MRKLVWCGAVVMVATAAAVYVAASHAAKHPDSYWGRCMAAAAYLGIHGNPFVALHPMAEQGLRVVDQACDGIKTGSGAASMPCKIHKPVKGAVAEEQAEAHEAVEPAEPVREVEADVPHSEPIHIEVFPGEPRLEVPPPPADEENVVIERQVNQLLELALPPQTAEPMTGEECEDVPPMLPPDADAEELPMPSCEEEGEGTCCWLWQMLKLTGLVHDADGFPEMLPMPCQDEESQEEMTEQPAVDPYHYHHNSCPYMGCPYPYSRCAPVAPAAPVEKPKKIKKKKVSSPESSSSDCSKRKVCWGIGREEPVGGCQKKKPVSKESFLKWLMGGGCEKDETPHATGVDTMEFRPSDDHRAPPGTSPY